MTTCSTYVRSTSASCMHVGQLRALQHGSFALLRSCRGVCGVPGEAGGGRGSALGAFGACGGPQNPTTSAPTREPHTRPSPCLLFQHPQAVVCTRNRFQTRAHAPREPEMITASFDRVASMPSARTRCRKRRSWMCKRTDTLARSLARHARRACVRRTARPGAQHAKRGAPPRTRRRKEPIWHGQSQPRRAQSQIKLVGFPQRAVDRCLHAGAARCWANAADARSRGVLQQLWRARPPGAPLARARRYLWA